MGGRNPQNFTVNTVVGSAGKGPAVNTSITIPVPVNPNPITPSANQGQNSSNNGITLSSTEPSDLELPTDTSYLSIGNIAEQGPVSTPLAGSDFPKIYLNFKKYEYSKYGMIFRFSADNAGAPGTTYGSWASDTNFNSFTLTGNNADSLKSVSAYGTKMLELKKQNFVKNDAVVLNPTLSPSYTILVFAVAKNFTFQVPSWPDSQKSPGDLSDLTKIGIIHRFVGSAQSGIDVYNVCDWNEFTYPVFIFNGSTLNAAKYMKNPNNSTLSSICYNSNNPSPNAYSAFNNWVKDQEIPATSKGRNPGYPTISMTYKAQNNFYNAYNLPNNLSAPSTATPFVINDGSSIDYNYFSLFFVQMHSFFDTGVSKFGDSYKSLYFQTFVNSSLTYQNYDPYIPAKLSLPTIDTYSIKLGNSAINTSRGAYTPKFYLLEYLHGNSYSKTTMETQSAQILDSLVYKYRSLLVKSSGDLQISQSNPNANLLFPIKFGHPYMNILMGSTG